MAKREAMQALSTKLPTEVIGDYTEFATQLGTTRNALILEALRAYLPLLRGGQRVLPDRSLHGADGRSAGAA